jgi:hypothetical protein
VGEANQGVYQTQLPGVIQFDAGNPSAIERSVGSVSLRSCPPFKEGFQNALLDIPIVVVNESHLALQLEQGFDI